MYKIVEKKKKSYEWQSRLLVNIAWASSALVFCTCSVRKKHSPTFISALCAQRKKIDLNMMNAVLCPTAFFAS